MKIDFVINFKNFIRHNLYFLLVVITQSLFSFLYGLKALQRETDFGIYYVGANSITENYGLYSGFFELKGPLYYGFIKILSYIFPYSFLGAICVLVTTCLLWFLVVDLVVLSFLKSNFHRALVGLGSITALYGQSSNASMSIFQSSIILISVAFLVQFFRAENRLFLYSSLVFGFIAILVKIDSLIVLLIIFLLLLIKRVKSSFIFVLQGLALGLLVYIFMLYLLSEFLKFEFYDMWLQSIYFVFYERWGINITDSTSLISPLYRSTNAISLVIISGLPSLIIFLSLNFKHLKIGIHASLAFVLFSSVFYIALNSDKDYHVFILYPFIIMSIIWMMVDLNLDQDVFRPYVVYLILASTLLAYNLITPIACLFTDRVPCTNTFNTLTVLAKDYENKSSAFFLNQGWPYLIAGTKPTIDFNADWPLKVYIPGVTERVIFQANSNTNETIWIDENMIEYSFFTEFAKNRFVQPKVDRFVPLSLLN